MLLDTFTDKGLSMAAVMKRQPEIRAFAKRCQATPIYEAVAKSQVERGKAAILAEDNATVEALVFMLGRFASRVAETTNELELVPVALYHFPIIAFLIDQNIEELAALDYAIPQP